MSSTDEQYSSIVYSSSSSSFDWSELVPVLVIYGFSFVLGLTGNCLIIFTTFRYRRMHSVTNVFLSSLASSDLLLIIFCIPVKVAKLFSFTWTMGWILCKSVHYMQNLSTICSVLTLTAISIERYYAIVHPVKSKYICTLRQAKSIILVIWIMSVILSVPTAIVWVQMPVGVDNELFWCSKDENNMILWKIHEIYLLTLVLIIPFSIMAYSYTFICYEVWKVMEHRVVMTNNSAFKNPVTYDQNAVCLAKNGQQSKESKKSRSQIKNYRDDANTVKQVIYMLVIVVVLFAICWTPALVDNILTAYGVLTQERSGFLKYMLTTFHLLSYSNSCINPIIYGFMSKTFRESFKLALCCSSDSKEYIRRTGSNYSMRFISRNSSQTRTTPETRRQERTLLCVTQSV
ncbi:gastrin/cholecystokinin type B receptor-like [Sitophilus oryzae]|uniref:Gastrin/cholecystokinin type B receptor-like n=1 Tax=Sitophilus oryzae TaxID=7048 RepID=A0A6J2XXC3_SITOR|nr:gastrin/cholecystokinin type B receptor-like [Sitophilus oryzae]